MRGSHNIDNEVNNSIDLSASNHKQKHNYKKRIQTMKTHTEANRIQTYNGMTNKYYTANWQNKKSKSLSQQMYIHYGVVFFFLLSKQ